MMEITNATSIFKHRNRHRGNNNSWHENVLEVTHGGEREMLEINDNRRGHYQRGGTYRRRRA